MKSVIVHQTFKQSICGADLAPGGVAILISEESAERQ